MLLSLPISALFRREYSFQEALDLVKVAGFDAVDFGFSSQFHGPEFDTPEFIRTLQNFREMASDRGIVINQAHAPFYRSADNRERLDEVRSHVVRSMRFAAILGIPHIIVHPIRDILTQDPAIYPYYRELNLNYFASLLPYCQEYGIRIAVENMNGSRNCAPCSTPEEFRSYMDELDNTWFTACLDIGHAQLCGDPVDYIRALGPDHLTALHIHDVDGVNDNHTLPYQGVVNWDSVMSALREIGYRGDFTYEANGFLIRFPRELDLYALQLMAQTGRHLISKFQNG